MTFQRWPIEMQNKNKKTNETKNSHVHLIRFRTLSLAVCSLDCWLCLLIEIDGRFSLSHRSYLLRQCGRANDVCVLFVARRKRNPIDTTNFHYAHINKHFARPKIYIYVHTHTHTHSRAFCARTNKEKRIAGKIFVLGFICFWH